MGVGLGVSLGFVSMFMEGWVGVKFFICFIYLQSIIVSMPILMYVQTVDWNVCTIRC